KRPHGARPEYNSTEAAASIAVISADTRAALGEILLPDSLGFAIGDQNGHLYINATERNQVLRLDAEVIATLLRQKAASAGSSAATDKAPSGSNVFSPPAIL